MPNPKRRHSKRRSSQRRAHEFLKTMNLSECTNCHSMKVPHRACWNCGYYRGRQVVETANDAI
jgi:large subunit ribosomal protein L32